MNELNATPHTELIAELMNPNNPKNEREHAAVREIERLREDQKGVDAVLAEREECAKLCDALAVHPEYASEVTKLASLAIRARK